jgi:hypothetical protein
VKVNGPTEQTDRKGEPVVDETGQAVMAMHDLTSGKYDVTVTTGPSFTTRREEAAYQMTEMMRALPQSAAVLGKHMAKNLDWPGADEIAEELEALSGGGKIPPEVEQMIAEGKQHIAELEQQIAQMESDRSLDEAELMQKQQQAEVEAQNKVKIALIDIEAEKQIAFAKIEAQKEIDAYKAQLNAAAQAARPQPAQAA